MTQEQKEAGGISLCIVQSISLDFAAGILKYAAQWAEERDMKGCCFPTPDGAFELICFPKENS